MPSRRLQTIVIILASLATIAATDIFLPSLPSLAIYFKASENAAQLSIPIYLLGSLLAAPILGTLSDHFGRRPLMLFGMGIFLFGTAACIYSPSLSVFLSARFVQGCGAAVSPVIGWAMVQDLYPADESAKVISRIGSLISLAPLIAPGLGGYIHMAFGWQGNFLFVFLLFLVPLIIMCFVKAEGRTPSKKKKLSFTKSIKTYFIILEDQYFLLHIFLFSFLVCGLWCYLTIIPFYFENALSLSPNIFGLYISATASFYILGAFLSSHILNWLGVKKTLVVGIGLALLGSSSLLFVSFLAPSSPLFIVITVGIYLLGTAIIWGPSTSRALQRFEDIRGAASAIRTLLLTFSFAFGGFMGSMLDDLSLIPLALFLLSMALGCWLSFQQLGKLKSHENKNTTFIV